jgi:5'-3' exonuclease
MPQPIPNNIKSKNPEIGVKTFNTLLVDGSNILEVCCAKAKQYNSDGREVGGIFAFLVQLKILLQKGNFRYVYVFWDGDQSGQLRYNLNSDYKANRDKSYDDESLSEYMIRFKQKVKAIENSIYNKKEHKPRKTESEKENFHWQRDVLIECLEELFIRQCLCGQTEADDFIGYYVAHKKPNERIVICSNDRDLTQLIGPDVIVYVQSMKDFVNTRNHTDKFGFHYENVVLKKMICGDTSDNIKGIKGVGETTLFNYFPQFRTRKVTLNEVIDGARKINEEREKNKQKPLKWASNIVERVTDGAQGEKVYEINKRIIDLRDPLMTKEAVETIDGLMYAPMDPADRSLENLYRILLDNKIDELRDETKFSNFFVEFKFLIDKEKNNK